MSFDFHPVLRRHVTIPDDHVIVCGVALGYVDDSHRLSGHRANREPVASFATVYDSDMHGGWTWHDRRRARGRGRAGPGLRDRRWAPSCARHADTFDAAAEYPGAPPLLPAAVTRTSPMTGTNPGHISLHLMSVSNLRLVRRTGCPSYPRPWPVHRRVS